MGELDSRFHHFPETLKGREIALLEGVEFARKKFKDAQNLIVTDYG